MSKTIPLMSQAPADSRACFCIGPQNGEPLCPCMMDQVTIQKGRYVLVQDLGPVPKHKKQIAESAKINWSKP